MKYTILLSLLALGACNAQTAEFWRTVEKQRAEGHVWKEIHCRQVTPNVPAITMDTPIGNKLVCNKLVKP